MNETIIRNSPTMQNLSKLCGGSHDVRITCSATRTTSGLCLTQVGEQSPPQFRVTSTASAVSDNALDTSEVGFHACKLTY